MSYTTEQRLDTLESQVGELFQRMYQRDRVNEQRDRTLNELTTWCEAEGYGFVAPPKRYVQVLLDGDGAGGRHRLYTYEDATMQGLQVGDAVLVPVGGGGELTALVVRVNAEDYPYGETKRVSGVL